jgi:hypothetical protein
MYSSFSAVMFLDQNQLQNGASVSLAANPTGADIYKNGSLLFAGSPTGIAVAALSQTPTQFDWNHVIFPAPPPGTNPITCGDGIGAPGSIAAGTNPCPLLAVDPNLSTPRVINFNLGVTHAFGSNMSLEVSYVGNHGADLIGMSDVNACAASKADAMGACTRPYGVQFPWLGTIDELTNDVRSNYNSLQATFTKRMSHGLSATVGYTYAHGLDSGSLNRFGLLAQNPNDPGAEYGNSDFDIRHRLTITTTYNLPGINGFAQVLKGWQVNAIVSLQSSQPWTINDYANNFSGVGDTSDRWSIFSTTGGMGTPSDFKGTRNSIPYCTGFSGTPSCSYSDGQSGASIPITGAAANTMINDCTAAASAAGSLASLQANGSKAVGGNTGGCFVSGNSVIIPPAFGTFGNIGRNIFRDSGFKNVDFSIFKNFTFKERYSAQFRLEMFNLFNHPIFANPYGASAGSSGGQNDPGGNPAHFGGTSGTPDVNAGNPLVGSGAARDVQVGLKLNF